LGFKFKLVFSLLCALNVFVAGVVLPCFGTDRENAFSAISAAEEKVVSCYMAVADAQRAGANVSDLLEVLNEAGWLLSKAKLAYSMEDFESAFAYANNSKLMLDKFVEKAEMLRLEAEQKRRWDFMLNFVGSAVGAFCIIVGGSAIWVFMKKREKFGRNLS
jgi:hypothetical protein